MSWFNIEEAMKTGVFVCGTSGSGKTCLSFHLAHELMNARAQEKLIMCES